MPTASSTTTYRSTTGNRRERRGKSAARRPSYDRGARARSLLQRIPGGHSAESVCRSGEITSSGGLEQRRRVGNFLGGTCFLRRRGPLRRRITIPSTLNLLRELRVSSDRLSYH